MNPSVYLYNESERGFEFYLGEITTLEGLSLFDNSIELKIIEFGATCYKQFGWTTENELPVLQNIESAISFLESEGDIGIVDFKVSLSGIGVFSTHDDGECHFMLSSKDKCISILKDVLPGQYRDVLINTLLRNPGLYVSCNAVGAMEKYSTFAEYLANTT